MGRRRRRRKHKHRAPPLVPEDSDMVITNRLMERSIRAFLLSKPMEEWNRWLRRPIIQNLLQAGNRVKAYEFHPKRFWTADEYEYKWRKKG